MQIGKAEISWKTGYAIWLPCCALTYLPDISWRFTTGGLHSNCSLRFF